jgi:hypothetical protein
VLKYVSYETVALIPIAFEAKHILCFIQSFLAVILQIILEEDMNFVFA